MYSIQVQTTDGVRNNLEFNAGKFIGTSTITVFNDQPKNVPLPSGVVLSRDLAYPYASGYFIPLVTEINESANTLSVRLESGTSSDGISVKFVFIRFK